MNRELSSRERAYRNRVGYPWLAGQDLEISPGPHLLLDWRFVLPGEIGLIGPTWTAPDGEPLPLRLEGIEKWRGREVDARYAPTDVPRGIAIRCERAEKLEPFPEGRPPGARILHDAGLYRSWYALPETSADRDLFYAESDDGFAWRESVRCSFDWGACGHLAGKAKGEVLLDPVAPAGERLKMLIPAGVPGTPDEKARLVEAFRRRSPESVIPVAEGLDHLAGMWGAVSGDGVRWKVLPEPLVLHYSDTMNSAYYDRRLERYVWFARSNSYFGRRCIGRAETEDFRRWPAPDLLVWPSAADHPADDWYTNSKTVLPGSVDEHLMFPALYHRTDDTSELRLFASPDGIAWSQVPGGAVLATGSPGAWDGGCVFGGFDLLPLPGNRVGLPYVGYRYPHKYPRNALTLRAQMAYAVWPSGRLGGIEAVEEGAFTTLPLLLPGERLFLNLRVKHAGSVIVEVADRKGVPVPGRTFADADPIMGDHLDHPVSWRGNAAIPRTPGQPVLLRFRLRAAKLFAFEVR